jgi:UDP-N-acetylglucosamine--N-acetylmuramyl-(pentapeptide) pyrophosphoryl-undecaprenol N-acetylglucosamine transferase
MYKIGLIGGHFTTAESVIEALLEGDNPLQKSDIVFFGKKIEAKNNSVEFEEINKLNIKFVTINSFKINRFFSFHNFFSILLFPFSIIQAVFTLCQNRVQVVIGFGGYLQIPLLIAAKILGVKIIIHEGTVNAGFANRIVSHFASRILVSFQSSEKFFKKSELVGCPIRKSIIYAEKNSGKLPILFVTGGHLGSKKINNAIFPNLEELLQKYLVIHQVGAYDYELALVNRQKLPPDLRIKYIIKKFFSKDEFAKNLVNASLLIGRSGINTVCEVVYLKVPAIFIPLSFSQKNEQYENARIAEKIGLAKILEEKYLSPKSLLKNVNSFNMMDLEKIDNSKEKEIMVSAADKIKGVIYEIIG